MTANRNTMTKLSARPRPISKETEIDFIRELADSIPEDSYLHSLFTPDLVSYVQRTIREDTSPDLYSAFMHAVTHANELYMENGRLEIANKRLIDDLNRTREDAREHDKETTAQYEELTDDLRRRIHDYQRINENQAQMIQSLRLEIHDLNLQITAAEEVSRRINESTSTTILKLKAQLFDLQNPDAGILPEAQPETLPEWTPLPSVAIQNLLAMIDRHIPADDLSNDEVIQLDHANAALKFC